MTALLSMIAQPLLANAPGAAPSLLHSCRRAIAGYFDRREALMRLIESDDALLRDIGLTRAQIEPAVRGRARRT